MHLTTLRTHTVLGGARQPKEEQAGGDAQTYALQVRRKSWVLVGYRHLMVFNGTRNQKHGPQGVAAPGAQLLTCHCGSPWWQGQSTVDGSDAFMCQI